MTANKYILRELTKSQRLVQEMMSDSRLLGALERVAARCSGSILNGGKIMFCGNGGSAADAQHLAAELVGKLALTRPAMAGLALTTDTSAITAIGNDFGFEQVFARQVEGLGRDGDVLVGISTSGKSRNVVLALEAAGRQGVHTVAMTGAAPGPMSQVADEWIAVPHLETQKIQEGHIMLGHIFCALVEAFVHESKSSSR